MDDGKMTHNKLATQMIKSISTSDWMVNAIIALEDRDILDVLNELDALKALFWLKYKETVKS